MGWNTGYTIFEATVIGAYDLGVLDKRLLAVLMEPYRGTDIDPGGSEDSICQGWARRPRSRLQGHGG